MKAGRTRRVTRLRPVAVGLAATGVLAAVAQVTIAAAAPPAAPAAQAAADRYPLVVDVDLAPEPACSGPVKGRAMLYSPQGAETGAAVEWRVRVDGTSVRTGTVTMTKSTATAAFEIPFEAVPEAGELLVDARLAGADGAAPGPFGAVWRDKLGRGCDPVRTVAVGDSVVWGQGLTHDQKFPYLTGKQLGAATGRGHRHLDYSISGAVLDAPELPAGNNDRGCLDQAYPQDPDHDGEMEFGEVTAQMPDVFCQLERAGADAVAGGYEVDLVVLNGCINDVDPFFGVGVGMTPGSENVPTAVRRECSGEGAAAENPAKDVPYFSGAKVGYGGRGMKAAIEKAHQLPGRPKVLVANFPFAFSRDSIPVLREKCGTVNGLTQEQSEQCRRGLGGAAERYEQYTRYAAEAYRQAAEAANAGAADGPYAVAGDPLYTLDNAVLARDQKVWSKPTIDPVYPLRRFACPEFSPTPAQCLTAAIAHPDIAGAKLYADNFALNPRLRSWFGLADGGGDELKVSADAGAPVLAATLDASGAAGNQPAGSRYTWFFGDGTRQVTETPKTTHSFDGPGPHLPRVVVTAPGGERSLIEAGKPVVVG